MSKSWENRLRGIENGYFLKKDREALDKMAADIESRKQLEALEEDQNSVIYKEVDIKRCPETGKLALSESEMDNQEPEGKKKLRMLDLKRLLSLN